MEQYSIYHVPSSPYHCFCVHLQTKVYECNELMIVTFEQTYLQELYEQGKTRDKKHRYQPDIVLRYQKCINALKFAPNLQALATINSLNYEELKGDRKGTSSIRVNRKYRVEFTVRSSMEEPIITICNVIELSNHYT